jgi:hypothetical protein
MGDSMEYDELNQPTEADELIELESFVEAEPVEMEPAEELSADLADYVEMAAVEENLKTGTERTLADQLLDEILAEANQERQQEAQQETQQEVPQPSAKAEPKEEPKQAVPAETEQARQPEAAQQEPSMAELLEEAKRIVLESRALQYAQQQAELINSEVRKLAQLGVRVTQEEIQQVVTESIQKGIDPYEGFKQYAYDLLLIQFATGGNPTQARQLQTIRQARTQYPQGVPAPTPKPKRPDGLTPLEAFLVEAFEEI